MKRLKALGTNALYAFFSYTVYSGNTGGAVCHQAVAPGFLYGGDGGTRTLDLTDVNRAL